MKDHITIQAQKTEAELEALIEALCTIPAPLGQEWARAEFVQDWLNGNGLTGSWIDRSGNVIFPYSCNSEKYIAFTAHMDTVFPDLEKFIKSKATDAVTTAAMVEIRIIWLYTSFMISEALSQMVAAITGCTLQAIRVKARKAV